ncbi:hypothetical protein EUGRSUZ_D00898 [Eucalyptus grandis]|uniref:Uncharacterized protein n=2 Tax=Eucalyptus grandis TaxID=71139 RepID=A0ACC3L3M8_EUCGR|nr:hypothetical protein EUGRSUZ_D00898 [Eucalyptus grandis]
MIVWHILRGRKRILRRGSKSGIKEDQIGNSKKHCYCMHTILLILFHQSLKISELFNCQLRGKFLNSIPCNLICKR